MPLKHPAIAQIAFAVRRTQPYCVPPTTSQHSRRDFSSTTQRRVRHRRPHPRTSPNDSPRKPHHNANHDPYSWPTTPNPTPYEILNLPPTSPYASKHRFHELVKLYHPDRHQHSQHHSLPPTSCQPLSRATKLHRYRLVITAHTILSSPHRRNQYDISGAGWTPNPKPASYTPAQYRAWRDSPHSPAGNATWEDWEEWHRARYRRARAGTSDSGGPVGNGGPYGTGGTYGGGQGTRGAGETLYMSNTLFASLVLMLAVLAGMAQYRWAENHAKKVAAVKDGEARGVAMGLADRLRAEGGHLSSEVRMREFVSRKERWG